MGRDGGGAPRHDQRRQQGHGHDAAPAEGEGQGSEKLRQFCRFAAEIDHPRALIACRMRAPRACLLQAPCFRNHFEERVKKKVGASWVISWEKPRKICQEW